MAASFSWDPDKWAEFNSSKPAHVLRVKNELKDFYKDPPGGIHISSDPENIMSLRVLIIGPDNTPYEGGFFYFILRFGPRYPFDPPRAKLLTTYNNTVRFNPNLYANGKVCLSILGTWAGPPWSPATKLTSLLVSIQSLMGERPYYNEPGFGSYPFQATNSDAYNLVIQHETLRVAVCEVMEKKGRPFSDFDDILTSLFSKRFDFYVKLCESNLKLDGIVMNDPFSSTGQRHFSYKSLLNRLNSLKSTCK